MASASIAELPDDAAATNFDTVISKLPTNAATIALLDSSAMEREWARLDSNQGPRDYESPALTT